MLDAIDWVQVYRWTPVAVGFMLPLIAASEGHGSKLSWLGCAPFIALFLVFCILGLTGIAAVESGASGGHAGKSVLVHWGVGLCVGGMAGVFFARPFARR